MPLRSGAHQHSPVCTCVLVESGVRRGGLGIFSKGGFFLYFIPNARKLLCLCIYSLSARKFLWVVFCEIQEIMCGCALASIGV
jgi:hypothetical protein